MSKYHEPIEKDPHQDAYYEVTLVHELFTITTLVIASDDHDAIAGAKCKLAMSEGLPDWVSDEAISARAKLEAVLA